MSTASIAKQKSTIYLNPYVKKFIQYQAVDKGRTMSDIINDEFADLLEDLEDAHQIAQIKNGSVFTPWLEVKKQLKKNGLL